MGSFGKVGRAFNKLGAVPKADEPEVVGDPPEMQFDNETNSQLLAVLDDF
jgi:hypothetical protein